MNADGLPEKMCTKCPSLGPFSKNKNSPDGLSWQCKVCTAKEYAVKYKDNPEKYRAKARKQHKNNPAKSYANCKAYRTSHPEWAMWVQAKKRAKKRGLLFTITVADVQIPERCPLLGVALFQSKKCLSPNSPTLDRRDSTLGYVKGNVWVISHRANTMKSDATLEELEMLSRNLRLAVEETSNDSATVH